VSEYRTAIDQIEGAVRRRAFNVRNQVAAAVLVAVAVFAIALIVRSPRVLVAALGVVPISGGFLVSDGCLLRRWRSAVLGAWIRRDIDLAALRAAIRAHPALPGGTIDSMLATLPATGDLVAEQRILSPTRRAIAAEVVYRAQRGLDALTLKVVTAGILAVLALTLTWSGNLNTLWGMGPLLILPTARAWLDGFRRRECDAEVATCRKQEGFSEPEYEEARRNLS
jgi:hypothetical protein